MNKHLKIFLAAIMVVVTSTLMAQMSGVSCTFTASENACVQQHVQVTYTGGAATTAHYTWDFGEAIVVLGDGQGPYVLRWETAGEKHITLKVRIEHDSCTLTRTVVVHALPAVFHMTGGGSYLAGGEGVPVGLSGSEVGVIYKLLKDSLTVKATVVGTGQAISFGKMTEPGRYCCGAKIDGTDCTSAMEGVAEVTTTNFNDLKLCMVTYDSVSGHSLVIWNKPVTTEINHFNIYRETSANDVYDKIAEIPYSSYSSWVDATSKPLVKSDKYEISATNNNQAEAERSAPHKTIHLNINPGYGYYNLIWNHYEGFDFLTYRIHRRIGQDAFHVIDSVASNVDSYTDFTSGAGVATYYIEVVRTEPCHPTLKSGLYYSVTSNVAAAVPYGIADQSIKGLSISPNPVKDMLKVSLSDAKPCTTSYTVLSLQGAKLAAGDFDVNQYKIDFSTFEPGMYFLMLKNNTGVSVIKILKQ